MIGFLLLLTLCCWIFIAIIVLALITLVKYGGLVCFILIIIVSVIVGLVLEHILDKKKKH
jgi:hypothetical protein